MTHIFKPKALLTSILISLGVGFISSLLTKNNINLYGEIVKPSVSPPSFVFPIVWTILFILMGISAYLIYISNSSYKNTALKIYVAQLIVNFLWSIIFFNLQMYLFAFIWLLFLLTLIILMIVSFSKINKLAAYLQIPYLIWVIFAGYLNLAIYLLNK
ncbi:TspO/MBR family protein [Anaerovorax odorimutans]|uniref:TspO/MBR family protein n=1 Tax=Anaerovorax odorimutans TaxID=109327 RepID=UPI0003FFDBCE|nr:TspO/MBR family protein [Anaerovorax odorimutans]